MIKRLDDMPRAQHWIIGLWLAAMLSLPMPMNAQQSDILDRFTLTEQGGVIYLSWTIGAGNTCQGTNIQRSADSVNFSDIGRIAGVCGSTEKSEDYDFQDTSPLKNQVNYYRLELGLTGYSEVRSVQMIDLGELGFQVRPNPASDWIEVHLENREAHVFQLDITDLNGTLVHTETTAGEQFLLPTSTWVNGVYLFHLRSTESDRSFTGKMIVTHD